MSNLLEVIKLDGRYNGHKNFRYAISPDRYTIIPNSTFLSRIRHWRNVRIWCQTTWGPSIELEEWEDELIYNEDLSLINSHWSWSNDGQNKKIYFKGDEELMMYNLRWS